MSVVVIVFNDANRLPDAVGSVLNQTLAHLEVIIVDDASTDDSVAVADELAQTDPRVRVVRLPENSGGCSRPRNTGIEQARGRYVMFLDSDDIYPRHACKNLLVEAERTGADVVTGRCVRVYQGSGRERLWAPRVFEAGSRTVFAGIRANPDLFFDTIATNKVYRRDFLMDNGIRFPEGLHYEDLLFTAQVYCLAGTIALIPTLVYRWNVARAAEQRSISQRRFEFGNFRDRVAVHRLIDAFLVEHGAADLKIDKDVKFVQHDLRLYLGDLSHRTAGYQRQFIELAGNYLRTVDDRSLERVDPVQRICVAMICRGDVEETLKAVDWLQHGFKLSTELVERAGRVYWSGRNLDDPRDRAVLDVTGLGLHRLPFAQQSVFNEVTAFDLSGGTLLLAGRFLNQLGQIKPEDSLRLAVEVKIRGGTKRRRFPVRDVRREGSRIFWSARVDLGRVIDALDRPDPVWDIAMQISWDGKVNRTALSIAPELVTGRILAVRRRFRRLLPGHVAPYVTVNGNLAFERAPERTAVLRAAVNVHEGASRRLEGVRDRFRGAVSHPALTRRAFGLFGRLPIVPGLTVFQSQLGQRFTGSPKYVYEAARAAGGPKLAAVWVYSGSTRGFPGDARLVRRGGWAYHWFLARAQYWVDDQGFPRYVTKRPGTTYVQTWHGTPLKKMGFDSPSLEQATRNERAEHQAMIDRWDWLLTPSDYFVETLVRSYRYRGPMLRSGQPRNDPLVRGVSDGERAALRNRLQLPSDRTIVLYAPTFRDRDLRLKRPFELRLDLDALQRELAESHYFLVRPHYLDRLTLNRRHANVIGDASRHTDINELLLAADVLVTDYSSVMFDYANLGRPMVFYTYDHEDYVVDGRGTYLDLGEIAPGPLVTDTDELIAALREVGSTEAFYRERYAAFRDRFCTFETGRAAETVVTELLSAPRR